MVALEQELFQCTYDMEIALQALHSLLLHMCVCVRASRFHLLSFLHDLRATLVGRLLHIHLRGLRLYLRRKYVLLESL